MNKTTKDVTIKTPVRKPPIPHPHINPVVIEECFGIPSRIISDKRSDKND